MDLLDFSDCELYFEAPTTAELDALIAHASQNYGDASAEASLRAAESLAPENLSVLVALYRYYFYQHRLDEALIIAERAMQVSGKPLHLTGWQGLNEQHLADTDFAMLRFYLLALKASSVILLRLGHKDEARARLDQILAIDSRNQLGAEQLIAVIDGSQHEEAPDDEEILPPTEVTA